VLLLVLAGCAGAGPAERTAADPGAATRGAVLPHDNQSGRTPPQATIRQELAARLQAAGLTVLPEGELEGFMARHRIRSVGGVTRDDAIALRDEAGVGSVAITSLELYSESYPPRIALTTRLVSTGDEPRILRMESVALAGDDSPGLLGMGMLTKPHLVRERALDGLVASLLAGGNAEPAGPVLTPTSVFRGQPLDRDKKYSVAVLPFFNRSSRRYAGEIVALHFIRDLSKEGRFTVVEPGLVRQELLQYRIIMEEGVSLANAELVYGVLRADLLLSGDVNDYADIQGSFGAPKVDFTALMLNRDNRRAGWAVDFHARGDDRVYLFDYGRLTTANALAAAMTRGAVKTLTATDFTPEP
jgi:hypothetical protein